jgi:uncharacterized protein (DUF1499 family)
MINNFFFLAGFITMTLLTGQANADLAKKLPLCPNSPNCVSSQAIDTGHYIAPFKISGKTEEAWATLKQTLSKQSRTVIVDETEDTLHAEATSLVFRFVDDINAILDAEAGLIHIRSASRIGYGDFGVNRKRVEALRLQLQKAHVIE